MDFEYHDDDALDERISRVTKADPSDETVELGATIRLEEIIFDDDADTLRESDLSREGGRVQASDPDGYSLEEMIGRGGMGVVYRARQESLDRPVALKTTRSPLERGNARHRSFVAEAAVTSRLEHPNIIPVHDLGEDGQGTIFFTMKLLEGRSWDRMIHGEVAVPGHDEGSLDAHLKILLDVANAVAYAHRRGFLHRDLKPENVLVGDFGEVVLTDWGLAARLEESGDARVPHVSAARKLAGTPAYFPPEMALGEGSRQGPWTDVYGLGGILYEILFLRSPNEGKSLKEAIRSALTAERRYEGELEVPAELIRICQQALAPDPADRFEDALAFRDALLAYLRHGESSRLALAAEKSRLLAIEPESDTKPVAAAAPVSTDEHRHTSQALFVQALEIWPDNEAARNGLSSLRAEWADDAERRGDLALAISQLRGIGDSSSQERATKLEQERLKRARQRRSNRRLRVGLITLLAVFALGSGIGTFMITKARNAAVDARDIAVRERDNYDRLAVLTEAELLMESAREDLWPIHALEIEKLEDWKRERATLEAQRPRLKAILAEVRARASRVEDVLAPDAALRARRLEHRYLDIERLDEKEDEAEKSLREAGDEAQKREIQELLDFFREGRLELEQEIADLEIVRRGLRYEYEDASDNFLATTLSKTLDALEDLRRVAESPGVGLTSVAMRTREVRRLQEFTESEAFAQRWSAAQSYLEEAPRYDGLKLQRRPDLYPLEARTRSGWLRFALLGSDPSRSSIENIDESFAGIVLILLPAGLAHIGMNSNPLNDGSVAQESVSLLPFLLAETETTRAQYQWIIGNDPSTFDLVERITMRAPVETVSAEDADEFCRRLGVELPSGSQFEYAARAGTREDGPQYAFGQTLADICNIADQTRAIAEKNAGQVVAPWNDGFYFICNTRAQQADRWGFHGLWGNVTEWTCDLSAPDRRYGGDKSEKLRRQTQFLETASKGENLFASVDRLRDFWGPHYRSSPLALKAYKRGSAQRTDAARELGFRVALTLSAP